ncbi:PIG-L family deacetylase [Microbacterium sp. 5K110]|uniref:PIG-L family deacetylase n=1 Tax=unclassified Microbacterium TaxID=2609290 RepID=UPI0010FE7BE6|nr:PIG-L family deacetylase [Microbacterium sp. 5K110]TLF30254.1 PIG-L family deacetylase [Microbacterium sp. 5K110]
MQDDDLAGVEGEREKSARDARRVRVTRRGLIIGGLALAGLGGGALLVRQLRRSGGPVGAWTPLQPIAPPAAPTELSPAFEAPGIDTAMTIWAHADDDIIFANPGLADSIAAGATVRAVYVTAGDAGKGLEYAQEREAGIRAAYDLMRGATGEWDERELTLLSGARVTRFVPADEPRLSITVLRLPDGGLDAKGFTATGHAGLTQLINGDATELVPIDGGPAYSLPRLTATLAELMAAARPRRVSTNVPHESAFAQGDHPDHSCVGSLVRASTPAVGLEAEAMSYYLGYPSQDQPVNVAGDVLDAKVEVYRTYAADDPVVRCADASACLAQPGFGEWLRRTYPKSEAELRLS